MCFSLAWPSWSLLATAADAPPILYPVAVVRGSREAEAARFVAFLYSPAARDIFTRAGFIVVDGH